MYNPGGPGPGETRNVIIAVALSAAIFLGFEFFYIAPKQAQMRAQQAQVEETQRQAQAQTQAQAGQTPAEPPPPAAPATREDVLSASAASRIAIDTPAIDGSIALQGGRIDDINLRQYRRTIERDSGEVTLLAPMNSTYGHDAFFGWEMQEGPDVRTLADNTSGWTAPPGARLTPATPVTLTLQPRPGVTIERTISIDDNFMFTISEVVRNTTGAPISVRPLGVVRRHGVPQDYRQNQIVHQGMIGTIGTVTQRSTFSQADKHARERGRNRVGRDARIRELQGENSWLGLTDHYWLAAIIPDRNEDVSIYFDARSTQDGPNDYRSAYRGEWRNVPAGGSVSYAQRLFAGAKRYELLRHYERGDEATGAAPISRFDWAIDWGNFWFLTRPFFAMLHWFGQIFASWGIIFNFGLAILASTVVVKLILFPLVFHSFKSMAKMRGLQPKMKEIQERYAADKQRQQQEILKLYQTEKINPVSGCLPMLLQIPVFYALYKTLTVTLEMRHAPFAGWINDLSARDPTSLFNLFGLLPFDVPVWLMIGAWPLLYGVSMWALQALSPPPPDPVQAQIFRLLPILFTFMFAAFPAGLVIYWTWSNSLSILQQYVIMRRQGVETQLDKWLKKRFGKSDDDAGGGGHKREPAAAE